MINHPGFPKISLPKHLSIPNSNKDCIGSRCRGKAHSSSSRIDRNSVLCRVELELGRGVGLGVLTDERFRLATGQDKQARSPCN